MPRRKKRNGLNKKKQPEEEKTTSEKPSNKDAMDASPDKNEDLTVSKWKGTKQPKRRKFPGPRGTHVPLRVAFEREAHVEVISHVKEFLDSEVCGVFAGDVCEDDEGLFVNIRTAIRGSAARQGRGHVTFTQETWDAIHETLDNE